MRRDASVRGVCVRCNLRPQKVGGRKTANGLPKYELHCTGCHRDLYETKYKYRSVLIKESCARCGFVAEHSCQLDIDHIDGNKQNSSIENLQVLCANCHRLKTFRNEDWVSKLITPMTVDV